MACIVMVSGGFGNQLFCYALGRHLELSYRCEVLYDIGFYRKPNPIAHNRLWLNDLGLPVKTGIFAGAHYQLVRKAQFLPLEMQRLLLGGGYLKYKPDLRTRIPASPNGVYFAGCWHDMNSFEGSAAIICDELRAAFGAQAPQPGVTTVAVHVRRADYLTHAPAAKIDYVALFGRARCVLSDRLGSEPHRFLVFSDDLPWCEQNLVGADVSYAPSGTTMDHFRMMLGCTHYLIANSTFSWWAAFLGPAPRKLVLLPARWHSKHAARDVGLVGKGWIEIDDLPAGSGSPAPASSAAYPGPIPAEA
jgi:Glycosyl transferase family 11